MKKCDSRHYYLYINAIINICVCVLSFNSWVVIDHATLTIPFQGLTEFQKIEKLKPGQEATVSSSFLAAAMLLENLCRFSRDVLSTEPHPTKNCGLSRPRGPPEFSLCASLLVYAGTGYTYVCIYIYIRVTK